MAGNDRLKSELKQAANAQAYALGNQQRNGFHVRRVVWGGLMAREERRPGEEIRRVTLFVRVRAKTTQDGMSYKKASSAYNGIQASSAHNGIEASQADKRIPGVEGKLSKQASSAQTSLLKQRPLEALLQIDAGYRNDSGRLSVAFPKPGSAVMPTQEFKREQGLLVKKYREASQLTQDEVAVRTGKTVSAISQWERGRTSPGACELGIMAEMFGCTIGELYPPIPKDAAALEADADDKANEV